MATTRVTNQQLAFAGVQVEAAAAAADTLKRRAHWQAALWQLSTALHAYAGELKALAQVHVPLHPGPGLFFRLSRDFTEAGRASAALDELVRLEKDPSSWLYRQQRWEEMILDLASEPATRSSVRGETTLTRPDENTAIALVDLDAKQNSLSFSQEALEDAVRLAVELIQRQRQDSAEY